MSYYELSDIPGNRNCSSCVSVSGGKDTQKDVLGDCPQQYPSSGDLPTPTPDHTLEALQKLSLGKDFHIWD